MDEGHRRSADSGKKYFKPRINAIDCLCNCSDGCAGPPSKLLRRHNATAFYRPLVVFGDIPKASGRGVGADGAKFKVCLCGVRAIPDAASKSYLSVESCRVPINRLFEGLLPAKPVVRSDRRRPPLLGRSHIADQDLPRLRLQPLQEGLFVPSSPLIHAGGLCFRFLGLRALSITRLAAFIAASLLSDVPDFVPVSVSTDHFQKPRLMPWTIRYSTPRCSMLGLPPRYD
jgi:hypothetical protein